MIYIWYNIYQVIRTKFLELTIHRILSGTISLQPVIQHCVYGDELKCILKFILKLKQNKKKDQLKNIQNSDSSTIDDN